jgi:hypothetical protein
MKSQLLSFYQKGLVAYHLRETIGWHFKKSGEMLSKEIQVPKCGNRRVFWQKSIKKSSTNI